MCLVPQLWPMNIHMRAFKGMAKNWLLLHMAKYLFLIRLNYIAQKDAYENPKDLWAHQVDFRAWHLVLALDRAQRAFILNSPTLLINSERKRRIKADAASEVIYSALSNSILEVPHYHLKSISFFKFSLPTIQSMRNSPQISKKR